MPIKLALPRKIHASKEKILEGLKKLMFVALHCHHNEIFNYLQNSFDLEKNTKQPNDDKQYFDLFCKEDKKQKNDSSNCQINLPDEESLYPAIFGNYNYSCFPEKIEDNLLLYNLITYGYISLVEYFLKEKDVDINSLII